MTLIPPQPCPICGELFTPQRTGTGERSKTCGSQRCRHESMSQHPNYQATREKAGKASGLARNQRALRDLVFALSQQYGPLSVRDIELTEDVWRRVKGLREKADPRRGRVA